MRKVSVASFLVLAFAAVNAQAAAVTLVNDGFEAAWDATTQVGSDSNVVFNYSPSDLGVNDLGWTFGASTGVVTLPSNSQFSAAEGRQFAFLQSTTGFLSQTFNVSQAGNVNLSFSYGLRPFYPAVQGLEVYLNGNKLNIFSLTAPGNQINWTSNSILLSLNAGSNTIAFKGTGGTGGDTTMFLDKVAISAVPEPTSALMLSLGLGGLLLARRRSTNA